MENKDAPSYVWVAQQWNIILLQEMKMSTAASFPPFVYCYYVDLKGFSEWNKDTQSFFGVIHICNL